MLRLIKEFLNFYFIYPSKMKQKGGLEHYQSMFVIMFIGFHVDSKLFIIFW